MVKKEKIWVLVGDGVHAQVYVIRQMRPLRTEPLPVGHFRGRDQAKPHTDHSGPGKSFNDDGGARHPSARHLDPHRTDKEIFVEHIGDFINHAARAHEFDRLIIVAPNKALGDLRRTLDLDIQEKIKVEIEGEWTKLSQVDLERHLADHLPEAATTP